jgi:hypothetical protein
MERRFGTGLRLRLRLRRLPRRRSGVALQDQNWHAQFGAAGPKMAHPPAWHCWTETWHAQWGHAETGMPTFTARPDAKTLNPKPLREKQGSGRSAEGEGGPCR